MRAGRDWAGLWVVGILSGAPMAPAGEALMAPSPNGRVQYNLSERQGRLHFSVLFKDHVVLEPSPLAILLDEVDLAEGTTWGEPARESVDEAYPWRGVHSTARNHYRGWSVPIHHAGSGTDYALEVRVFDDGIAFRHVIPAAGRERVPDEHTRFHLPSGTVVWYHDLEGHYEAAYHRSEINKVKAGQWMAPPLTFQLPEGAGYGSITEAALENYSGMALRATNDGPVELVLGHAHPASYPFRLRYSNDVERLRQPATLAGAITSPWRVVMIGADLNALVNSDIVHNLCPPPDPTLFPAGLKTEWIKPGRAVWKYLDGGRNTGEEMAAFSGWAGELGFEYHVIEGFWSRWSEEQIRELVASSRARGVGLWFWKHSRDLRTPAAREEFFQKLQDWGVVGAKIDFFDHEHKEVIDLYGELLRTAARHHILVNFHGANKPTGEMRTWPNELIREGVRGMEARLLKERARHDATLPFTRYLAGPADYTPVHFGARRGDTTWAHQIATAVVFDEPLLTYAAHPTNLLQNPAVEMIKSIPSVWDETVVLPPSKIGELVLMARRSGKSWYLAILNGPEKRALEVPLAFLPSGTYDALIVADSAGRADAMEVKETQLEGGHLLPVRLESGGGFVCRLVRKADRAEGAPSRTRARLTLLRAVPVKGDLEDDSTVPGVSICDVDLTRASDDNRLRDRRAEIYRALTNP